MPIFATATVLRSYPCAPASTHVTTLGHSSSSPSTTSTQGWEMVHSPQNLGFGVGGHRQRNGGVHSGCKSIIPVMEDYQLLSARGQIINIFDCLNPASAVRRIMSSMQRNRCNYPPTKMIKFGPWDIICVIPSPSPRSLVLLISALPARLLSSG